MVVVDRLDDTYGYQNSLGVIYHSFLLSITEQ